MAQFSLSFVACLRSCFSFLDYRDASTILQANWHRARSRACTTFRHTVHFAPPFLCVCIRGACTGTRTRPPNIEHTDTVSRQFHFISFFNSVKSLWQIKIHCAIFVALNFTARQQTVAAAALVSLHGLAIVFTYFHFIMTRLRLISIKKFQSIHVRRSAFAGALKTHFYFESNWKFKILSFLLAAIFHLRLYFGFSTFFFLLFFFYFLLMRGFNWVIAIKFII